MPDWILPLISLVLGGLGGLGLASVRIGEFVNRVKHLEDTVGHDEHGGMRKTLGDVRDKVIACEATIKANEPFLKRESPISLTERGQSFLEESGGKNFVEQNFDVLKQNVEQKKPKTSYDIQEFSRTVLQEMSNETSFNPLKDYLFKEGLNIEDLISVMGVYLRNKILEEKGVSLEDIDKTDPSKNDQQTTIPGAA